MNSKEYTLALFDFFKQECQLKEFYSDADSDNIAKLSKLLKINMVTLSEYKSISEEHAGKSQNITHFYTSEEASNLEFSLYIRKVLPDGSIMAFEANPPQDKLWNDEEKKLVEDFLNILFFVKSKIRLADVVYYAANYEPELGLPNMAYGLKTLDLLIQQGKIGNYTAFFFNIKNMTVVNSSIGFPRGTGVLLSYINKIRSLLKDPELLWRIGGDNFGIIASNTIAPTIIELLEGTDIYYGNGPYDYVKMSASAGVYQIDESAKTHFDIMDAISASMYLAKQNHTNILFYDANAIRMIERGKNIESSFETAISTEAFKVFYQPKVSIESCTLSGAEALCRWQRGSSLLPPDYFVPILEKNQNICTLDFYMLNHVCADLKQWLDSGLTPVPVSVNFSRKHLSNPNFIDQVIEIVDKYKIPHRFLIAEFTETTTVRDLENLKGIVFALRSKGIKTSVDDFGTGYSSLSLIRDIAFDELKIDKSFLDGANESDERKFIMMKHVISMANELEMSIITEGVERREQIEMLKNLGCLYVQGFFFDRPLQKMEFEIRLRNKQYSSEGL